MGVVTRKGLKQKIGEPAINEVPRRMIIEAVQKEMKKYGYPGNVSVEISIPEGIRLAEKTFNPRLGIEGGISVLSTSGIVEPMSEQALTETIFLEMKMLKENGRDWCYIVPGNYGSDFLRENLGYDGELAVKCSNYIGETIDDAVRLGMKGILLIGHVGKLVKIAAGVMNTHSAQADCRMEVLASHAAMAGADSRLVRQIMGSVTTTEALELLQKNKILKETMDSVMDEIDYHLRQRAGGKVLTGAVMFSNEQGILGKTGEAEYLNLRNRGE